MLTATTADIGDALTKIFNDIEWLKRRVGSPQVMGIPANPEFDTITLPDGVVLDVEPPGAPTGVTITPGAFYDQIFADVAWTENTSAGTSETYDVELAKVLTVPVDPTYDLISVVRLGGTDTRLTNLEPETNYAVRITAVNPLGIRGASTAWTAFATGKDTTIPPAPTGVIVARGATTVIVKYTPLTSTEATDVANGRGIYEIHIDTSSAFNTGNFRSMRSGDQIVAFNDIFSEGTWHARVRAIDASGNVGPWSSSSSGFAGAVTDSMIVAGLDAAKITAGFLSASRIEAGTLTVDKLTSSTLTSANITINGGSLRVGNPTTDGLLINSQGLRLYDGGVAKVILDSSGSATFTGTVNAENGTFSGTVNATGGTFSGTIFGGTFQGGTFRTASTSNTRVEMSTSFAGEVRWYWGTTLVAQMSAMADGIFLSHNTSNALTISSSGCGMRTSAGSAYIGVSFNQGSAHGTWDFINTGLFSGFYRHVLRSPQLFMLKELPNLDQVHVRDYFDSYYITFQGELSDVSGEHLKTDVQDHRVDAFAKIRNVGLKSYRKRGPDGEPIGNTRIGFMAADLPPELTILNDDGVPEGYYVGGLLAYLLAAVQQVEARLRAIENRPAPPTP